MFAIFSYKGNFVIDNLIFCFYISKSYCNTMDVKRLERMWINAISVLNINVNVNINKHVNNMYIPSKVYQQCKCLVQEDNNDQLEF